MTLSKKHDPAERFGRDDANAEARTRAWAMQIAVIIDGVRIGMVGRLSAAISCRQAGMVGSPARAGGCASAGGMRAEIVCASRLG
jgi:hypothetical protein